MAQDDGWKSKLTTIQMTLRDKESSTSQWIYWFSKDRRGKSLIDSCYLEKGQKKIELKGYLEDEEYNYSTVFFSKEGPNAMKFYLVPGDNAKIDLNTHGYEGTTTTSEIFEEFLQRSHAKWRITKLESELKQETDLDTQKQLSDSIEYYEYLFNEGITREMFKKAQASYSCYYALIGLREFLSDEEMETYISDMKARFPDSKLIQSYPDEESFSQRETSEVVDKREDQLWAQKYGKPLISDLPEPERERLEVNLDSIVPYNLGDHVGTLKEKGLGGELISLEDINTPYVLIDFWASWCTPCLREMPQIKKVVEKYTGQLSIYAVSLDDIERDWKRAIQSKKIESFTHVRIGGFDTPRGKTICTQFNIKFVPSNFLLDKDRKIVATNLTGSMLKEKMQELYKNQIEDK